MLERNVEKALRYLRKALALLEQPLASTPQSTWIRSTGQLSEEGIAHLNSLFDSGKSTYAAAKEMGISYRSAALRRKQRRKDAIL